MEDIIRACYATNQHCLILPGQLAFTPELFHEILQIWPAVVACGEQLTVDDFNDGVRIDDEIARALLVQDIDLASIEVQVQILELLRSRRIFSRDSMLVAPKDLVVIATVSAIDRRPMLHLNDLFAASCPADHISSMRAKLSPSQIALTAEMDAYLHNIVLFARMSRYVQGGVTAASTKQFRLLSKALAAIQGVNFVTPSTVMRAARAVYPHRLQLATAETEKSLQWGSDQQLVAGMLETMTIQSVIDDIIASVPTPL